MPANSNIQGSATRSPSPGKRLLHLLEFDPYIAGLLALAILAAIPLFYDAGLVATRSGGDSPFLLLRTYELADSLQAGIFPVRWMPHTIYGYGIPFFNYYAALPYYLAALLRLAGFAWVGAIKLTQVFGLLAAALGMYGWSKGVLGTRSGAFLAAVAYTYAPFHLVNMYVRGDSLSELYAFVWFPLILWAIERVCAAVSPPRIAALAVVYGALIFTHNVSAMIFSPFVALYALFRLIHTRAGWRTWLAMLAGGLIGIAFAAWFWLPALAEIPYTHVSSVQTAGFFHYSHHFRLWDLVQTGPFFDYFISDNIIYGRSPFNMSLIQALLTVAGVATGAWLMLRKRDVRGVLPLGLLGLATFMIMPFSQPLYDHLPLLPYVQFPWRFLSVQALFASLVIGYLAAWPSALLPHQPNRLLTVGLPAVLVGALVFSQLAELHPEFLHIDDDDVNIERFQLFESFTQTIGTTVSGEYLPQAVWPFPATSGLVALDTPPPVKVLQGEADATRTWERPDAQAWQVQAGASGARIAFPTHYFPGWSAYNAGQRLETTALPGLGWITVDTPPGTHEITLRFEKTPARLTGETISLLALALISGLAWPARAAVLRRSPAGTTTALIVLGAGVLTALVTPAHSFPDTLPLTMDFAQQPYLSANPVSFDKLPPPRLLGYTYSNAVVQPGDTFTVSIEWGGETNSAVYVTIELTPAWHPMPWFRTLPCAQCLYVVQRTPMNTRQDYTLPIPSDLPPGRYYPAVLVGQQRYYPALTDQGNERSTLYLRPIRVMPTPTATPPPGHIFALGPLTLSTPLTPTLDAQSNFYWSTAHTLPINYAYTYLLQDSTGFVWSTNNTLVGNNGFYPTALWHAGETVPDPGAVALPEGLPPGATYTVTVNLLDSQTLATLASAQWPSVWDTVTKHPGLPLVTDIAGVGLHKLDVPAGMAQGQTITLTAHYLVTQAPLPRLRARWTLQDASDLVVYTRTAPLAPGADTRLWPQDAYVLGKIVLAPPAALPPSAYTLQLTVLDDAEHTLGTYTESNPVVITTTRTFAAPALARTLSQHYDQIDLLGYTLTYDRQRLTLDLAWMARNAPTHDYKVYLHLVNPDTQAIVASHDNYPRNGSYPMTQWLAGEVIADFLPLDLRAVPPGHYQLALGLYDDHGRFGEPTVFPEDIVIP